MDQEAKNTPQATPAVSVPKKNNKLFVYAGAAVGVLIVAALGFYFLFIQAPKGSEKVYHVGVLNALDYFGPAVDGFKSKMTELGYVEGKNIIYDIEKGAAPVGNQTIIKKFVDDHVDLIVAFPTEASLEAKEGTKGTSIPVISIAASTEDTGLIESVQHPGGNLTGVRFPIPEVAAKRLEILHELVPKAKHIWVPYLKDYPTIPVGLGALEELTKEYGITITAVPFATPDEMASYLAAHEKQPGIDAVLTIPEPLSILPPFINQIYAFADAHNIPVAGAEVLETGGGPIFSLIPNASTMGTLAAPLADKIFKGADPGTIPIVTSSSVFEINYTRIQELGLTVNESLLSTADKIIH
ncbi:MAG: ABC transporter substrate-binding protein [Patescibacteria group bacterium]